MEEKSLTRNHLSEASGKHLGRIWEASGKHLGGIWEAFGGHLGGWRLGRHLGGIWRSDLINLHCLSARMQKFLYNFNFTMVF